MKGLCDLDFSKFVTWGKNIMPSVENPHSIKQHYVLEYTEV